MCHVLIIEDEVLIALDLQGLLAEHGATSFDFADCEDDAIQAAMARPPDLITSDVKLRVGTGPKAVVAIHERLGPTPVIFITGNPEACEPGGPAARVLGKPLHEPSIARAFRDLAPLHRS